MLKLSADEDTYRLYEAREHSLLERNSLIADGIARGVEQGKLEIIKNMQKEGMDIELIVQLSGLPKHKVEEMLSN